ncbi:MAG: RdgB/HAM1 family non-canonical purine NTP pyrophosphatase [Candidatus Aenigmarchaeota archaeon]|nr:RdgB/HAM1 family non-canonical purine NTP pyrophosphatase [Candidatus Aenigmarchaeota archaeon]
MKIAFATGNKNKVKEINFALKDTNINIIQKNIDLDEPRSESLKKIAIAKAKQAQKELKIPVIVEDSGLFIKNLNDFPGTFSKWVFDKIKDEGIINLMADFKERSAIFKAVIVYSAPGEKPIVFEGKIEGKISSLIRGKGGFGFDPIFIPKNETQTWAKNPNLKANSSHRKQAIDKFVIWAKESL